MPPPGDHPALGGPGPGGIEELVVAADLRALALDPAHRGLVRQVDHAGEQDLVAGKAEGVGNPVALAPAGSTQSAAGSPSRSRLTSEASNP